MWKKLTPIELEEYLDKRVIKDKKVRNNFTLVMTILLPLLLGLMLSWEYYFPSDSPPRYTPTIGEFALRLAFWFIFLGLIFSIVAILDKAKYRKMNQFEKRKAIIKKDAKIAKKVCISCGILYGIDSRECSSCGGRLEILSECIWIEDN